MEKLRERESLCPCALTLQLPHMEASGLDSQDKPSFLGQWESVTTPYCRTILSRPGEVSSALRRRAGGLHEARANYVVKSCQEGGGRGRGAEERKKKEGEDKDH